MKKSLLALVAALAACSGGTGTLTVSSRVGEGTGPTGPLALVGPASTALVLAEGVALDRVRIVIRKVMLVESDPGTELNGTDGAVVAWSPTVIDLAGTELDGGVEFLVEAEVPAGTWDGLAYQFHKLTPGEAVGDPDFAPLGHSIVLDLVIGGEPFQFTSDLTAVAVLPGPFTVEAGGVADVTVTIDPSGWFTGTDGAFLDPRLEENRSRIEWNLKRSIRGEQVP